MSISDMLDRTLTIQRMTVTQSPAGAPVRAPVAIATGVMFCVAPASDRIVEFYARRDLQVEWTLYTDAPMTDLIAADAKHAAGIALRDLVTDPVTDETWVVLGKKYYANAAVSDEKLWELHCQTQGAK